MTSEGLIDSSFGTNGIVLNALSLEDIYLFDAILQPDGKILAVGQYNTVNSALEIFVVRLLPDGSFDNSFNQTGVATVSGIEAPKAMVIQPDGKIVVIGNNILENPAPFYLVRFNMNGSRDWIFGNDGIAKIIWESGEMNRASSLAIQSDGKIVASGWVWYPEENTQKWGLARLDGNGQADSTFGQNGRLITSFRPGFSLCRKIALLSDNKIIAVGSSANDEFPETGTGVIARYMPDAHTSVSSAEHTSQEITIYPNPATDKIWISSQSYHQIDYAIVWTIAGRQLVTQYNNNFIDVSCISAGTYFLKISMDKGKSIYSIPFIIHH